MDRDVATEITEQTSWGTMDLAAKFVALYEEETDVALPLPTVTDPLIETEVDFVLAGKKENVVVKVPSAAEFRDAFVAVKPGAATEIGEIMVTHGLPDAGPDAGLRRDLFSDSEPDYAIPDAFASK